MPNSFNKKEAKAFLAQKEKEHQAHLEQERLTLLNRTTEILRKYFKNQPVEVFLVGSITRPHAFTERSDIDIVVKNFTGNRFEVAAELETKVGRTIEFILYEKASFKDHIDRDGFKVL